MFTVRSHVSCHVVTLIANCCTAFTVLCVSLLTVVADQQEKSWVAAAAVSDCGGSCVRTRGAHCLCGTSVGRYQCACDAGHHLFASRCVREFSWWPTCVNLRHRLSVLIQRFNAVLLHDCFVDEVAGHSS